MSKIHVIARAAVIDKGYILLTKCRDFFFLPGGHVKHAESIPQAAVRELSEEAALDSTLDCFIGAIECVWDDKGSPFHEINFVFKLKIDDLVAGQEVLSKEPHISFHWVSIKDIEKIKFLPKGMKNLIVSYADEGKKDFVR